MVQALEKVLLAAELLERGQKVVKALRKNGNTAGADQVQKACDELARSMARKIASNRKASLRARRASRDVMGRLL